MPSPTLTLQDILSDLRLLSTPSSSSSPALHPLLAPHHPPPPTSSETHAFLTRAHDSLRLNAELVAPPSPPLEAGLPSDAPERRTADRVSRVDFLQTRVAALQNWAEAWESGLQTGVDAVGSGEARGVGGTEGSRVGEEEQGTVERRSGGEDDGTWDLT